MIQEAEIKRRLPSSRRIHRASVDFLVILWDVLCESVEAFGGVLVGAFVALAPPVLFYMIASDYHWPDSYLIGLRVWLFIASIVAAALLGHFLYRFFMAFGETLSWTWRTLQSSEGAYKAPERFAQVPAIALPQEKEMEEDPCDEGHGGLPAGDEAPEAGADGRDSGTALATPPNAGGTPGASST